MPVAMAQIRRSGMVGLGHDVFMRSGPAIESPNPLQRWLATRIRLSIFLTIGVIALPWALIATAVYVLGDISVAFPIVVWASCALIWLSASVYAMRRGPAAGLTPDEATRLPVLYLPWFRGKRNRGVNRPGDD